QPYVTKGVTFARHAGEKTAAQAAVIMAQHPEKVLVGGVAAGSTAFVAGTATYAHKNAVKATAQEATVTAAQAAAQNIVKAAGSSLDVVTAYAQDAARWVAATRVAQVITESANKLAATPAAQMAAQGATWTVKSMKAYPERWVAGIYVGAVAGVFAHAMYKDHQRRAAYRRTFENQ
ncbi:hypothetical protein CVU75_03120, partial [Candidatus Dependentiae bacterium HGW-Dependentiae-1]